MFSQFLRRVLGVRVRAPVRNAMVIWVAHLVLVIHEQKTYKDTVAETLTVWDQIAEIPVIRWYTTKSYQDLAEVCHSSTELSVFRPIVEVRISEGGNITEVRRRMWDTMRGIYKFSRMVQLPYYCIAPNTNIPFPQKPFPK